MSIKLHTSSIRPEAVEPAMNPLPALLQTPSGLALLEMQGTINLPEHDDQDATMSTEGNWVTTAQETPIGRLIFPEIDAQDPSSTVWMKRVYLYVGKHQRLTGEVKKLPKAIAIIRKRADGLQHENNGGMEGVEAEKTDELEIVEIVRYKILFSTRPEPVGTWAAEE